MELLNHMHHPMLHDTVSYTPVASTDYQLQSPRKSQPPVPPYPIAPKRDSSHLH